jgi:glycogen synthase
VFVLPRAQPIRLSSARAAGEPESGPGSYAFHHVRIRPIAARLSPYASTTGSRRVVVAADAAQTVVESEEGEVEADGQGAYGPDIYGEVRRFAQKVLRVAQSEEFDVIHAHDWMTFPAGVALAAQSGKPLVVQVHSTEFDRSGEHVNQYVYDIERQGMHAATRIIAVSNYTRNLVISRYDIQPSKVEVVYNGVELNGNGKAAPPTGQTWPAKTDKVVLFLGRITMQKGPEYFLYAAKKVLEKMPNVKFIMAGDGDMLYRSIELAAQIGIGQQVLFTRFLRGEDVNKAYQMADLYVMPSVSEPFGIAPLEAVQHDVPVIMSKQSGIAEIFRNALKVDFWDINEMANKMVAVLRYSPLHETLRTEGRKEIHRFRWEDSAAKVNEIYHQALGVA